MQKKSTFQSAFASPRVLIAILLCAAAACWMVSGTVLAVFGPQVPAKVSNRTLTFAERVSYQRAIEEVYWRHRIWPKERPDPKPSLDAVMSQAQLEKKVEDYLRNSQALEDYWQRPITAEQLQAEMERMAKQSKRPEVLRELFEALGNDPFVIAECLARPALAERLLKNWYAYDERIHGELKQRVEADLVVHPTIEQMRQASGTYSEVEFVKGESAQGQDNLRAGVGITLNSPEWDEKVRRLAAIFGEDNSATPTTDAAIEQIKTGVVSTLQEDEDRYYAIAVIEKRSDRLKIATVAWPKEPFQSWRARAGSQVPREIVTAIANYTLPTTSDAPNGCVDDTWASTSTDVPNRRYFHTSVWTGSEVIVWGGHNGVFAVNTGERYNPSTDSWTATSITNAPSGRYLHTAVWTGSEMIIWGGVDASGNYSDTGGRYNPSNDMWTATSARAPIIGRALHTAVWSGSEMIVWGGFNGRALASGSRYNPATDHWTFIHTRNPTAARYLHTAVWTGNEMIIWGGYDSNSYLNSGARYSPGARNWIAISSNNAPSGRGLHTAVWTGSEMVIWGGSNGSAVNTGGRYSPSTDNWTATSAINVPDGRYLHTTVWTGSEMIAWGGIDQSGNYVNTGGKYTLNTDTWIATGVTNAPSGRDLHTAVWTGSEMIICGGYNGSALNAGSRYNPGGDSWIPTSTSTAPAGRSSHTAVWTGSEMIVWGGDNGPGTDVNSGGRYNPATDIWTDTDIGSAPEARGGHTAIWTGTEMIVWGGWNSLNFYPPVPLGSGGRYNPVTNSWTDTSGGPSARGGHTAVWTGTEMIVWGGYYLDFRYFPVVLNDGGRYNPSTNSWTATSMANTPSARRSHTAVWTGSEMIVWGGVGGGFLNTGGRYNPGTNSWTATSTTNAPRDRILHTAVWTGNEMIVWGGGLNTGGRYNPGTNSWVATNTTNAPSAREVHTAIWTGSEMIVWGGHHGFFNFNTGGRYNPGTNSWVATNTTNAPSGRYFHTAVWTGSEMIVWGGGSNTGGKYCAQIGPTTSTTTPTVTPPPRPTPPR